MSKNYNINKFIQNNHKVGEEEEKNEVTIEEANKNNNDSFNKLLALQLLIQKHSGLKELCKFQFI
jgi:hypothetical protein